MRVFFDTSPRSNKAFRLLPLFHGCGGISARDCLQQQGIRTIGVCEGFNEKVTCLFHGRAQGNRVWDLT